MLHGMIAVQAINQVSVAHRARLTRRLPDKGQLRGPGWRRPCRARPADRSLVAEDRSTEGPRPDGKAPVHDGYTPSRQLWDGNGHERSRPVTKNRRSTNQRSRYQAALEEAGQSSSLPTQGQQVRIRRNDQGVLNACNIPRSCLVQEAGGRCRIAG